MFELLFDPETGRVRVTPRLACMINRKGCKQHKTDSSLLRKKKNREDEKISIL